MQYLISENQIVGQYVEGTGIPANFELSEPTDLNVIDYSTLYADGLTICQKPPHPSPEAYWDHEAKCWKGNDPATLEQAIAQQQQACLTHWGDRIRSCTAGYPAVEVSTWIDFKQECERLIATQDISQGLSIYHEIMLRQLGAIATPQYCQQYQQDHPQEALAMALVFAGGILEKNAYLLPELTRLKGLRGYHWEQIGALESTEAVQEYDFTRET